MKISVIGFGYIGSVIGAVLSSRGHRVFAIDNNQECIENLNKGKCSVPEPLLKEMISESVKSKLLSGSSSYEGINESDVILVTVGTSLSDEYDADLSALRHVFKELSSRVVSDQIIMIKSTVPPGVTRLLASDYFGSRNDIFIGFSPERLAEGNAIQELNELPIIVGGINDISTEKCSDFWTEALNVKVIKVSSCETAELVKLANNQWIDLNIALANELATLCDSLPYDIDILEVIRGANSLKKGQHFVNFLTPSIGVGGYCLTKDPWFVSTLGDKNQRPMQLPRVGRTVNDSMPYYCCSRIIDALSLENRNIAEVKISILGYSFKSNSGDTRFSPMITFVNSLIDKGCNQISVFDSTISLNEPMPEQASRVQTWQECVKSSDFVVFGAAHRDIISIEISQLSELMNKNGTIFDGRRYFTRNEVNIIKKLGLNYMGIGRKFV
ncbi:nucleotide sugar dehydrogenase [Candidatus Pelagibacter sp.]|nr:nucleotide sugar dehydrogenase [Candidatus Pelagibacter sp.]